MKKVLSALTFVFILSSCSKKDTPTPVEKTYAVQYKLDVTSVTNATLAGSVIYTTKTNQSANATFSAPGWTVTESNWPLKSGDKVGFTADFTNASSYNATLLINGAPMKLESATSTLPINGKVTMYYTMP